MSNGKKKNCRKTSKQLQDANLKHSWFKQAYLMTYLHPLVNPLVENRNPSKYVKLLEVKNHSDSVVNRFTISPEIMTFLDGRPVDYGQLVPQIEVYKVYLKDKESVAEVLFPFRATTDFKNDWKPESFLKSPFRGREAGIESVDVKMDGRQRNPFSAKITHVTIKYVFNDVKTLFKEWKSKDGRSVQYSDLIRYPPSMKANEGDPRSFPASFRIKLVLGWNVNVNNPLLKGTKQGERFLKAAQKAKVNFVGDMTTHNMEFKEDGSVELTVEYKGALERAFSATAADLMNSYSVDDNEDIRTLKAKLNKIELTLYESATRTAKGERKRDLMTMIAAKKALKEAEEAWKQLKQMEKNGGTSQSTFAEVRALGTKAWKSAHTILKTAGISAMKGKQNLINETKPGSSDFKAMQTAVESATRRLATGGPDEKSAKKLKAKLKKVKDKIESSIEAIEANMRAQYLFIYLQRMMENNLVSSINTDKSIAFQSYTQYRDILEGGESEEVAAFQSKIEGQSHSSNPPTGKVDTGNTWKNMQEQMAPEKKTEVIAGQNITIFKKVSSPAKLFSDKYEGGSKLMFFTLGDLISTILKEGNFGEGIEQLAPNFRIIFGEMEYDAVGSTSPVRTSLYNLPISVETFVNFIAVKIVGTNRKAYPLMMFIQDLVKFIMDKVAASYGKGAKGAGMTDLKPRKTFKLDLTPIDLPKEAIKSDVDKNGKHSNYILDLNPKNKDKFLSTRKLAINDISNTFLLFGHRSEPFRERIKSVHSAHPVMDREEGIPHFMVGGPNRGVVKRIGFKEHNNSLFSTAMWRNAQAGGIASGRGLIRPSRFTCEVELVGNPYFYIGQYFYVNTNLISGGHFVNELIMNGGYYIIMAVQSSFGPNGWETTITGTLEIADVIIRHGQLYDPVRLVKDQSPGARKKLKDDQKAVNEQTSDAITDTPQVAPADPNATPTAAA